MNDTRRRSGRHPDDFAGDFEVAFARLRVAVLGACGRPGPWQGRVAAALRAALGFAADHPEAARTLTLDVLVEQPGGGHRYLRLVEYFAGRLREAAGPDHRLPDSTEQAVIAGVLTLIGERTRAGLDDPAALARELTELALVPYLGREEARRWAAT